MLRGLARSVLLGMRHASQPCPSVPAAFTGRVAVLYPAEDAITAAQFCAQLDTEQATMYARLNHLRVAFVRQRTCCACTTYSAALLESGGWQLSAAPPPPPPPTHTCL